MSARRSSGSRAINVSLKHLRAVRDVAEFGSFTAAAASLGMTQPGVSRLISHVERDLGVSLFLRSTRSVVMTDPGREFVQSIGPLLAGFDAQVESARSLGGSLRGRLVISCLLSLTHHMVPETLVAFRERHPRVEIQVREGLGAEVYEDVRSGLADFAIGNAVGVSDDVLIEHAVEESCLGVLPARHRLAAHKQLALHDLAGEPLVSLPPASGLRRLIDGIAAMHGIALNHLTVVEQFGSLFDVVAAGLGVGIVPPSALPERLRPTLRAKTIMAPPIVRKIGILRLRNRGLTPAAASFLDVFRPRFMRASGRGEIGTRSGAGGRI